MSRTPITPTGREAYFAENDIIVSKTDLRGIITYANDVFVQISGYSEAELLGQPHNIIRHPEMPGCVFKLLWDTLREGREIFAYVLNMCKSGDSYWVFAHVTPSFSANGRILGYHSNRRVPHEDALSAVRPLYAQLLAEESRHRNRAEAIEASTRLLLSVLKSRGQSYDEFVFSLSVHTQLGARD
jgi:PAS domain S-box-containing protein